jgi:hypothetical protein
MMDRALEIFLYVLIFGNALLAVLWIIVRVIESRRGRGASIKPKLLWRDLFGIVVGLIGWYMLSTGWLSKWPIFFIVATLLALSTVAAELIDRASKRGPNDAT